MTRMLDFLNLQDYKGIIEFLKNHIVDLKNAGADFVAIASNTPHIVFNELVKVSPLPLVSIIESTCKFAEKNEYKRVLILGTKFTMQSGLYTFALKNHNITAIVPDCEEIEKVHSIIFPKLEQGIVIPEDKKQMINIANKICEDKKISAVVLGCTEIPIMIKPGDLLKPVLNTTKIHVDAILDEMFNV